MQAEFTSVATPSLRPLEGGGQLRGLGGLTAAELRRWFPWRVLAAAGAGLAVLALVRLIWSAEENAKLAPLLYGFFGLWIGVLVLVTVAMTQEAVAAEIEQGTAAWLMSKPIGRSAFVLSKFVGAVPAVLVGFVGIPAVVARIVLEQAAENGNLDYTANQVFQVVATSESRSEYVSLPTMSAYASLTALIATLALLVVAVMVLLGCVVRSRAAVLGLGLAVPTALLLGGTLAPDAVTQITPASLFSSIVDTLRNEPAPALAPIVVTGLWIAALLAAAAWSFSRKEL